MKKEFLANSAYQYLAQLLIIPENLDEKNFDQNVYQRNLKNLNKDNLKKDLSKINWQTVLEYEREDPNFSFDIFEKEIKNVLDEHMPFKKLTKKDIKQQSKPWITQGIKTSIKRREQLYAKYLKSKNIEIKEEYHRQYKDLRNQLVTISRQSKSNYYQNYFSKNANNA